MNTRFVLSAAFAASLLPVPMLTQAQAPVTPNEQKLEVKVESLQAQVNALQAQVKRLQAQVRASSPSGVISPFYKVPNFNSAPFQNPGILHEFGIPGNQIPGIQGSPQLLVPRTYSNIPPCSIILINQKPR